MKVLDPETGRRVPPRRRSTTTGGSPTSRTPSARSSRPQPTSGFEGYYRNEAATDERFRDGAYWSGDLAYRDADGWLYFAGRSNEWLRVDGENFAAGAGRGDHRPPPRRAVGRCLRGARRSGRRSCDGGPRAARPAATFDADEFDEFLDAQPDLGPKWRPSFVRVDDELPKLSSMKLDKKQLRAEAWRPDGVVWRPGRRDRLRALTADERVALDHLLG